MKPMLACSKIPKVDDIQYPVIASPKLDGIRCLIVDGEAVSRNLKPIPNKYVRARLKGLPQLDGELMLKSGADFNSVQSAFMSEDGEPDFVYMVFDSFQDPNLSYDDRREIAEIDVDVANDLGYDRVQMITAEWVKDSYNLCVLNNGWVTEGYEGSIVRDPEGPYKFGRSTMKQGWMLKLKHFSDSEAEIISFEEAMHNANAAEVGELGQTKRSSHAENMVGKGTMGAIHVKWNDVEFKIGTGFNDAQRAWFWVNQDKLIGKLVKFKYQEVSKYGVPRFPVFLGLRDEADL